MQRIFGDYAYGDGPRAGCWWDETCDMPRGLTLSENVEVDVAVVGGGFTGVSAALRLAEAGVNVALFEARYFGWGASGRNGGFCCLGGGRASDRELDSRFGKKARLAYRLAEKQAVAHVEQRIMSLKLDVDRHSAGETELAHRPKDMPNLRKRAKSIRENYGVEPQIIERSELAAHGFGGGPFFGALTIPVGFGLNPRKYLAGLVGAAQSAGAQLFERSPVESIKRNQQNYTLACGTASVKARRIILATNGYASENVPDWLAGRYMPAQSTVLVTRPLTPPELEAQGWKTDQMAYDSRHLLHYFRLMPDRRFLFGMRGGLRAGAGPEASARRKVRADFEAMFPAWAGVEAPHAWSGFVCLARNKLPFVAEVPGMENAWIAMCYHGNGVAMGSYSGKLVADLVLGNRNTECPAVMRGPLARFPLGAARRVLMPPVYAALRIADYC